LRQDNGVLVVGLLLLRGNIVVIGKRMVLGASLFAHFATDTQSRIVEDAFAHNSNAPWSDLLPLEGHAVKTGE
jgi:hypothetical protein